MAADAGGRAPTDAESLSAVRWVARSLLWAGAGACLSPTLGLPLWLATEGSRFADFVPLISACVGAVVGVVALFRGPRELRSNGALFFALTYPVVLGLWLSFTGAVWGLVVVTLPAVAVGVAIAVRVPAPPRKRVRWCLATAFWLLSVLLLPLYIGVAFVPLAVAVTLSAVQAHRRSDANDSVPAGGRVS